jgi:hypothetical protein
MGAIYGDLLGGHYDQRWVDVFFQNDPRQTLSMVDAYAFVQMWTRLNLGHIYHVLVEVGHEPCADAEIDEMNRRLGDIIPPFTAQFRGGTHDFDGAVSFSEPITLAVYVRETEDDPGERRTITLDPGQSFSLEVGTVDAAKMFIMLRRMGRIARWPYSSRFIHLLRSLRRWQGAECS